MSTFLIAWQESHHNISIASGRTTSSFIYVRTSNSDRRISIPPMNLMNHTFLSSILSLDRLRSKRSYIHDRELFRWWWYQQQIFQIDQRQRFQSYHDCFYQFGTLLGLNDANWLIEWTNQISAFIRANQKQVETAPYLYSIHHSMTLDFQLAFFVQISNNGLTKSGELGRPECPD